VIVVSTANAGAAGSLAEVAGEEAGGLDPGRHRGLLAVVGTVAVGEPDRHAGPGPHGQLRAGRTQLVQERADAAHPQVARRR